MHEEVLSFWFREIDPKLWWSAEPDFDERVRHRFLDVLQQAAAGELYDWRTTASGRLAEIIVLDQFSRNVHRDTAAAFASDALALALAQEAVARGCDRELPVQQRAFMYLPYMHSESPLIHEEALRLFATPGLEHNLDFERRHKAVIDRYGRYPHRNAALGRVSTAAELEFLQQPGSSF